MSLVNAPVLGINLKQNKNTGGNGGGNNGGGTTDPDYGDIGDGN